MKHIEEKWNVFLSTIPAEMPPQYVDGARLAFYAGVMSLMNLQSPKEMQSIADVGNLIKKMADIHEEMNEWSAEIQARAAIIGASRQSKLDS